jgi:hypothetical protein
LKKDILIGWRNKTLTEETCWFCGRTKEQLIKEDVTGEVAECLEEKKSILVKMESAKWVNMPSVCCVCLMLFTEHLINNRVVFEDELKGLNLV